MSGMDLKEMFPAPARSGSGVSNASPGGSGTEPPDFIGDRAMLDAVGRAPQRAAAKDGGGSKAEKKPAAREKQPRGQKEAARGGKDEDGFFTDTHLTDKFAQDTNGRLAWAKGLGWLRWTGKTWREVSDETVTEMVRLWAKTRFLEASDRYADGRTDALLKIMNQWKGVLGVARIAAIVRLTKGKLEAEATEFDADPDVLNCRNGVVDLRTGELLPHDPKYRMTKMAGADYRPGATHPDWKAALTAIPEDVHGYYQVRVGQGATGYMTPDDKMVIFQGGGQNGKSTLASGIAAALGEYYYQISDRLLLADANAHPTEFMDLRGIRFAALEELPEARHLDPQRLKKSVGTPRITARRIRQDSVSFQATHTLVINTNHKPYVSDSDWGTWRRLELICCPYTYCVEPTAGHERPIDHGLRERLKMPSPDRAAAILAWIVEGAVSWYQADRVMPKAPDRVAEDTAAWRRESDVVLRFLDEWIDFDPDSHIMSSDLLLAVNAWLKAMGHRAWNDKTVADRFGGHEEFVRHDVVKKVGRNSSGLSRPALDELYGRKEPEAATSWFGLAFKPDKAW